MAGREVAQEILIAISSVLALKALIMKAETSLSWTWVYFEILLDHRLS